MEAPAPKPAVFDIGAGTGLMSAILLEKFPDARLTLMDTSERILDMARKRFATRPDTTYLVCDYSRSDLGGPLTSSVRHSPSTTSHRKTSDGS